jgi:hypothetical protein
MANRRLSFFCACIFAFGGTAGFGQVTEGTNVDGPVGFWPFTGNTDDESGHSRHALLSGATPVEDRYDTKASAYAFSDADDFIRIPSSKENSANPDFTISFWFKSRHYGDMELLRLVDRATDSTLYYSLNNNGWACRMWWGGGSNVVRTGYSGEFTDGFWHNIVFLRKGATLKFYFDGALKAVFDDFAGPISSGSEVIIGGGTQPWSGATDDALIYDRAVTEEEIRMFANQPKIIVTAPDSLSALPVGLNASITWLKPMDVGSVRVDYSINKGISWDLITAVTDTSSVSFNWVVPDVPGQKCLIKITELNEPYRVAVSDTFVISKYKWELINRSADFSPRDGAGAYVFNDQMLLAGGWNPLDRESYPLITNNEIWQTKDGLNWSLQGLAPWEPRHTFGAVVFKNKMWVLGGDQLQCSFQPDVWSSEDGLTWNLVNEKAPWGERMLHMVFVFDDKMWVMGGQKIVYCNNTVEEIYNDVWNSEDGITWNLVTDSAEWTPRGLIGGSVVFKNKMWILGGGQYQKASFNDIWNSEDGLNWSRMNDHAPWIPRQYHSVAVFDDQMWVMEGYNGGNRNGVWHSEDGARWYKLIGTPWGPRHASSVFNFSNALWIAAGNMWNDVWRLRNVCPAISLHPRNQKTNVRAGAAFTVEFSATQATYRWQIKKGDVWTDIYNGGQFTGASTNTLTITQASLSDNGYKFRCVVSSGSCVDVSKDATLFVCGDFDVQPKDQVVVKGQTASFHSAHSDGATGYQWQTYADNEWKDLTNDARYDGVTTTDLTVRDISMDIDGQQFRVLARSVDGACESASNVALLKICPDFELQPVDNMVNENAIAIFNVIYPEVGATYQWQTDSGSGWVNLRDSEQYSGTASNRLIVTKVTIENNDQKFACMVSGKDCSVVSQAAILLVCPGFTEEPSDYKTVENSTAIFQVAYPKEETTYQWQTYSGSGWVNLSDSKQYSGTMSNKLVVTNATMQNNDQKFVCIASHNDCSVVSNVGVLTVCPEFTDQPSDHRTLENSIAVFQAEYPEEGTSYQWQTDSGLGWVNLSDSDQYAGTTSNRLVITNVTMQNNGQKFICIASHDDCIVLSQIAMLIVCPEFDQQPSDHVTLENSTAVLQVVYPEAGTTYQWQTEVGSLWKNLAESGQFSGTRSNRLVMSHVTMENNGQRFHCTAYNAGCVVNSEPITLKVCPDFVQHPLDQSVLYNADAVFSVNHPEASATYQWQTEDGLNWLDLSESGQFSGTNSNQLVVSNVNLANHGQRFVCVVRHEGCAVTSRIASLTSITESAVFPNPFYDSITITLEETPSNVEFSINDRFGQVYLWGSLSSKASVINLGQLARGVYTLKLTNGSPPVKLIKM